MDSEDWHHRIERKIEQCYTPDVYASRRLIPALAVEEKRLMGDNYISPVTTIKIPV